MFFYFLVRISRHLAHHSQYASLITNLWQFHKFTTRTSLFPLQQQFACPIEASSTTLVVLRALRHANNRNEISVELCPIETRLQIIIGLNANSIEVTEH